MRPPLDRGEPIDAERVRAWLVEFAGYRTGVTEGGIERWLDQYDPDAQDVAARVLDAVELIGVEQIATAYRGILASLDGWGPSNATRRGKWRFVAFSGSPGESGDSMLHRFRIANGLGGQRYKSLFCYKSELTDANLGPNDTVVFVDDFAGSGQQACGHWPELAMLLPRGPRAILALVGATSSARQRITNETSLIVTSHFELTASDNVFHQDCACFSQAEKERLLEYCARADRKFPRGRGDCGLLLVFAHNCPNNAIPLLHVNKRYWRGLFPRHD